MVQMDMEESFQLGSDDDASSGEEPENPQKRKQTSSAVQTPTKRQKTFKQPTTDELNHLRETENLFNSNIFRLQIQELLKEVRVKEKHERRFASWFSEFEKCFAEIEELTNVTLKREGPGAKKFVGDLLDDLEQGSQFWREGERDVVMSFVRPKDLQICENFSCIRTKIKFAPKVSAAIPKSVFYEKDYLNGKYLLKKSCYLFYLKQHLKTRKNLIKSLKVTNHLHNPLLPTLTITPSYDDNVAITLLLHPEPGTFNPPRFSPDKNNLKKDLTNLHQKIPLEKFPEIGTPFYNTALLFDVTLCENQRRIKEALAELPNAQEGIKLINVWISQRKFGADFRGFSVEIATYFLIHLIDKKKINRHMSSYQVVRIFWASLSQISADVSLTDTKDFDGFRKVSPFVLLDWSGVHNVAGFLDAEVLANVKNEAKFALDALDNVKFNTFSSLFTEEVSEVLQFDAIIKINDPEGLENLYERSSVAQKFDHLFYPNLLVSSLVLSNLRRGLTDRVTRIVPILGEFPAGQLRFGLNLNPETHANVITKGPKQFESGSADFKEFWGELAELRRFKDTSICEAVYFGDAKTVQEKRQIFKRIVDFVLGEKLQLKFEVNGAELEALLDLSHASNGVANEEATLRIKSAHSNLGKILRELKLPLSITALQCISDVYSYTEAFPPLQTSARWRKKLTSSVHEDVMIVDTNVKKLVDFMQPVECVIQLAIHSKWPKTLEAFRAMKTMFLAEMSNLLRHSHNVKSVMRDDSLDVYYEGFAFRLFLYHPKEIALLKQDVTSDGVTCYKDTSDSLRMERQFDVLPKISGALNGLQQMYPSFGPSTCLAKRWLRSQLLDGAHIPDTVVNLLNASLFLAPEPHRVATLPQVAFMRFLRFFAEFDPKTQPIIVNFNNDISREILSDMETRFLQNRSSFASLHVLTPYDDGNSVFTRPSPTADILNRLKVLAGATYKHLSACYVGNDLLKYKGIFVANVEGYDVTIQLKASLNPRSYQQVVKAQNVKFDVFPFDESVKSNVPVIGFNPVEIYLNELREMYGDLALFFHNSYGGDSIYVLWTKKALETVDFKISNVGGRKLANSKLVLNAESIVEDFRQLGAGLVERVVQNL